MVGTPGAGFRGPAKLGEITQLQCITITGLLPHRERAQADAIPAPFRDRYETVARGMPLTPLVTTGQGPAFS
jgi:hypothetical protein